jgi:ribosomal protein S15P/S13E
MKFNNASEVEQVCWDMRQADYTRGTNRALINDLMNGCPPFKEDRPVNVNFLEGTRVAHDARAQFYSAFLRPGKYFSAHTDEGPKSRVQGWSQTVTGEMNRRMKRSMNYFETFRSKFALDVLHGIGPGVWKNGDAWCPDAIGIEDIGIPSNTYLTMENLPFFYIYRSYTAPELIRLTRDEKHNSGWNTKLVESCLKEIDKESTALMGNNFPEIWTPEKVSERIKGDGGFYSYDQVPLIYAFDFYFWNDNGKSDGWSRRIILDQWSNAGGAGDKAASRNNKMDFAKGKFLYTGGTRKYAGKWSEILSFQFADLSAVAPFRYHSVRSLGFLLYAVCHLQNRLRCRFSEAVFEALMQFYRVNNMEDADRALYLNMIDKGFIDQSIQFVPAQERWQVNAELIELGMQQNNDLIEKGSSGYFQPMSQDKKQKTKFEVMAEIQASTALVSSAFNQAYEYQNAEYREIFRRFCKKNSTDVDVLSFQAACLRQGVHEKTLYNHDAWDIEPSRVMGAGNKTLELAMSEQLLQMRQLYDPDSQREILREITFNVTDDAAKAERWVPTTALKVSDSVHDAQLAVGTLMIGNRVDIKTGQNHAEYVATMLQEMELIIGKCQKSGGMAKPEQIQGLQNMAQHIQQHIQILAQDKEEKAVVAAFEKQLSKLMNYVKAFMQRLQEAMKKQQQQQGQGADPKEAAKAQAMVVAAKSKAAIGKESHAQKTAQRQISWEKEEQRKDKEFAMEQQREHARTGAEIVREHVKTADEVRRNRMKNLEE